MQLHFEVLYPYLGFILQGVVVTLKFTLISLFCGMPLGILLAFGKLSSFKPIQWLANAYTAVFRGVPLLLQLGIIFYATPQLFGYPIGTFEAGVIAFSLNSAAYSSEIFRSGIQCIDKEQWEVSQVLALTPFQTMLYIILPQAVRNSLPALVNELVNLLKESALISTIGEYDLMQRAKVVAAEKFMYFEPLLLAALLYFIMVMIINAFAKRLEQKLTYA